MFGLLLCVYRQTDRSNVPFNETFGGRTSNQSYPNTALLFFARPHAQLEPFPGVLVSYLILRTLKRSFILVDIKIKIIELWAFLGDKSAV